MTYTHSTLPKYYKLYLFGFAAFSISLTVYVRVYLSPFLLLILCILHFDSILFYEMCFTWAEVKLIDRDKSY